MKQTGFATLKGDDDSNIRVNTSFILAYGYNKEKDKTLIWYLGMHGPANYPGDQRREISMAIETSR